MRFRIVLLVVLSWFAMMPTLVSAESVKVFVMAGQSNMGGGGRVENLPPEWNVPQDDVWIWLDHNIDGVGDWVNLEPGHGNSTHAPFPDDPEGVTPPRDGRLRIGPELSLGRSLADAYPDHQIALVKHTYGGRNLESHFHPENLGPPESPEHMWSGLLRKTGSAFEALDAAGHTYEVEGFFFSLGGGDSRNFALPDSSDPEEIAAGEAAALARGEAYGENLTTFITAVRNEFSDNLPFVMPLMVPETTPELARAYPGFRAVRAGQLDVMANVPSVAGFEIEGLTVYDGIHYDALGQIEFGQRFAASYFDSISQTIAGDYNRDGCVDVFDIDLQSLAMNDPNPELKTFDENEDGVVDVADRTILIHDYAKTYFGDANLDGEFNTEDLVAIFQAGQYEDSINGNSTWATGDWNGDGDFGTNDLVLAFQDGGFEQGPRVGVIAVPEPTSSFVLLVGVIGLVVNRRRRLRDRKC